MSVPAMNMDERPLKTSYEKMSKQYEQTMHASGSGGGICSGGTGGGNGGGCGAPPSGPASPTPSGSEEPSVSSHSYHRSSHHHHSHSHHHHHQVQQQQQQSFLAGASNAASGDGAVDADQRHRLLEDEVESLKAEQSRLKQKCYDAQMREQMLLRRLAHKDVEYQDYINQIAEYKRQQAPSAQALRSALLDPAINLLFEKMKKELKSTKAKLEETQNELTAWKFTPDSNTGKRLMAKCRLLYQENEELGKMTSSGRLAKLETELAMQKAFNEEVRQSQSELDDFLQELDEDVEGMQSTIMYLQQELKTTRERIQELERENSELKNEVNGTVKEESLSIKPVIKLENGNIMEATICNNGEQSAQNQLEVSPSSLIVDDVKLPVPTDKYPIIHGESESQSNTNVTGEYYNNSSNSLEPQIASTVASNATTFGDDGSNGSNNSLNGKFRTAASRKRNYDSDSTDRNLIVNNNSSPATVIQQQTPRTLPPKKSKLRLTPVRRASAQSNELNENDCITPSTMGLDPLNNRLGTIEEGMPGIVNDEIALVHAPSIQAMGEVVLAAQDESDDGVAQRILSRRRSVRTQQNGSANGGGNGESAY